MGALLCIVLSAVNVAFAVNDPANLRNWFAAVLFFGCGILSALYDTRC